MTVRGRGPSARLSRRAARTSLMILACSPARRAACRRSATMALENS
jgi:hypothetical protein